MNWLRHAVAVALVALLSACGDGPREDYGDRLTEIATSLNRALVDLGTTVSQSADADAIAARLRRQTGPVQDALARLRALEPPDGAESAHRKLVSGVEDYLTTMRRAADVGERGDLAALVRSLRPITAGDGPGARKIREAAEELDAEGFRVTR